MYDFKPKPKSSFIAPTKDTPVKHRTRAEIMAKLEKRAAYLQQDDLTAVGAVMQAYYQRKLAAAKEQDLPAEEIDNQKENQPSLAQEQEVKSIDVQQSSIPDPVQIKCAECGNEDNIQQQLSGQKPDIAEKSIQQIASIGFSDSPTRLPHIDQIQQSLGVDLSHVQAYIGGSAKLASQNIGAAAFTSGNKIAFKEAPSIELASHEAAHIVQQQSGKVELPGGVGQIGDKYEQNADAVAARVEAGKSAKDLLTDYTHQSRQPEQLQRANLPANQEHEQIKIQSNSDVHNRIFLQASRSRKSKPRDCPTGTVPIDQSGLSREEIHKIKKQIGAGAADWVGVTPDGEIVTSDSEGNCESHGHKDEYLMHEKAEERARNAIPKWVWATITAAGAAAVIACFASGVCEFGALTALLGSATAAIVINILRVSGIHDSGSGV